MNEQTRDLVYMALLSALTALGIVVFRIPAFSGNVYFHLGETFILASALILGKRGGAIVGAVGSALGDTLLGAMLPWAPISFIIHGVEGYLVGSISDGHGRAKDLLALISGVLVMIIGYVVAVGILYGKAAIPIELFGDTLQGLFGIIFSWALAAVLRKNVPAIAAIRK